MPIARMMGRRHQDDKILYSEELYERALGTFKKLKVALVRSFSEEGQKVYGLEIKGVRHKFDMRLSFMDQDLCFMSLDEMQEDVQDAGCFSCLRHNYNPRLVYSRLLLIWYTVDDDGSGQCVKIPLVQKGNRHAANLLMKLQHVIKTNIITEGDMIYWRVSVVRCGHLCERDAVILVITKYAVVIVYQSNILHHHSFYCCQFGIICDQDLQQIQVTITDRSWINESTHHDNFALTRTYIFKTSQCEQIEKCLKSYQRKSLHNPQGPSAHFNIRHSEQSASDWFPGSGTDNMALPEVCPYDPVNNNTHSSEADMSLKIDNITMNVHPTVTPRPHFLKLNNTSSNGQIPSSDSGSITLEKRRKDSPDSLPIFTPRGIHTNYSAKLQETEIQPRPYDSTSPVDKSIPSPCLVNPTGTFPGTGSPHHTPPHNGPWTTLDIEQDLDDETLLKTVFSSDDELPPPPPPCSKLSKPHVSFTHKPVPRAPKPEPLPERKPKLMRSHSYSSVLDEELANHLYINVEQELTARKLVHGDSPYYRFYTNTGYVQYTRMFEKLKRRSRLSQEMKDVDFNKLENHEKWYDFCYKKRSMDTKFNRLSNRLNIPVDKKETPRPVFKREVSTPDDPYWSGDLSLTIQAILQEKATSRMLQEIQDCFDVSYEQLVSIQVLLSLVPSENNWRNMAEFIGLDYQELSIIEHFCYTYHELTSKVVLIHWIRQARNGKCLASSFENLQRFLEEVERDDIINILRTCSENQSVQSPRDEIVEVTHF